MEEFSAEIDLIGVNPFVFVPDAILQEIFKQAGKASGYIPITGTVNDKLYRQTLVKFRGHWRLYINTKMLPDSPKRIGERIELTVRFDPEPRSINPPEIFLKALAANEEARAIFDSLPASRKLEIVRYLAHLKTDVTLEKNCRRAINFLLGNERFIGRDKP